jgi:hypothetical protein
MKITSKTTFSPNIRILFLMRESRNSMNRNKQNLWVSLICLPYSWKIFLKLKLFRTISKEGHKFSIKSNILRLQMHHPKAIRKKCSIQTCFFRINLKFYRFSRKGLQKDNIVLQSSHKKSIQMRRNLLHCSAKGIKNFINALEWSKICHLALVTIRNNSRIQRFLKYTLQTWIWVPSLIQFPRRDPNQGRTFMK